MYLRIRAVLIAVAILPAIGSIGANLAGAAFPERPVRIIAAAAGAGHDVTARIIAPRLGEGWGQPVIVENRGGAGGTIAAGLAAKAAPDGHTLLMADLTQLTTASKLYGKLAYDPRTDFAPVTLVLRVPLVVTAHPAMPATNLRELIAHAKQRPGSVNYASGSSGTPSHLTSALLGLLAGIDIVHVPYKGGAAALVAVLGREVQFASTTVLVAAPHVASTRLRALAVAARSRASVLPEVPTSAEAGLPGLESAAWFGIVVPARTPSPVITKLNRDIGDATRAPLTHAALLAQGGEAVPGTPKEFEDWIRSETAKWGKVIQATGARAQ